MNFNLISPEPDNGYKYRVKFRDPITIKKNSKIYLNFAKFIRSTKIVLTKTGRITLKSSVEEKKNGDKITQIFPRYSFDGNKTDLKFEYTGTIPRGEYNIFNFVKEIERVFNEGCRNNKNRLYYYRPNNFNFDENNLYDFNFGIFTGNQTSEGHFRKFNFDYTLTPNTTTGTFTTLRGNMIRQSLNVGTDTINPQIVRNTASTGANELSSYAISNLKYFHWQNVIRSSDLIRSVDTTFLDQIKVTGEDQFLNSNIIDFIPVAGNAGSASESEKISNLTGIVMLGLVPYEWAQNEGSAGRMGNNVAPDASLYTNGPSDQFNSFFKCPLQVIVGSSFVQLVAMYPTGKNSLSEYENPVTDIPDLTNTKILFSSRTISNFWDPLTSNRFRLFTYVKNVNFSSVIDCKDITNGNNTVEYKSQTQVLNIEYKVGDEIKIEYINADDEEKTFESTITAITDTQITLADNFSENGTNVYFSQDSSELNERIFICLQYLDEYLKWVTLYETNEDSEDFFKESYFTRESNTNEIRSNIPWSIITSASEQNEGFQFINFAGFDQNNQNNSNSTPDDPVSIVQAYDISFSDNLIDILNNSGIKNLVPNISTPLFNQEKYFLTTTLSPSILNKTYSINLLNLPIANYKNKQGENNGGYSKPILKNCALTLEEQNNKVNVSQIYEPHFKEIFDLKNNEMKINYFDVEINDAENDILATEIRDSEINFTIIE